MVAHEKAGDEQAQGSGFGTDLAQQPILFRFRQKTREVHAPRGKQRVEADRVMRSQCWTAVSMHRRRVFCGSAGSRGQVVVVSVVIEVVRP